MQQQVNPDRVEQLSRDMNRLRSHFQDTSAGMYREINRLIDRVESEYPEANVQSAARMAKEQLRRFRRQAEQLDDHLYGKVKALKAAANQYRVTENKVSALTRIKRTVFSWRVQVQDWLSRLINYGMQEGSSSMAVSPSRPAVLDLIRASFLKIQERALENRLASVSEDPRVAALFARLDSGNTEEQVQAREELEAIATSFEGIARSQTAYQLYEVYGNRLYMEQAHEEAEKQRQLLTELGVSAAWYKEGTNLSAFQKGSPLDACTYNPLKQDGSPMPKECELRLVIAAGIVNGQYREWARANYGKIEAAVQQAAEQKRKLQDQLDTYNREVPEADIRKMQQMLQDMNLYHGEITGKYNEEFLIAVAGYQHIANTVSSIAAVRRDAFGLEGYTFQVDGKITKELLDLAVAERGIGIRNNPDLDPRGTNTAFTAVGVGEGVVKQLFEDGKELVELGVSVQLSNPKFWTETIPGYYDLGKAIARGEITYESVKDAIGEGLAAEYVVPFQQIRELSDRIFSGKASYEESVTYGRALTKAAMALTLVSGAAKSGAKLSANTSKKLSELLPKIADSAKVQNGLTHGGIMAPIPNSAAGDLAPISKTPVQDNFLRFMEERNRGFEGTGQALKVPQGLTQAQFDKVSSMIREKVGHISDDIVIQGSRAKGTAKPTSDIDIAIRVPSEKFDELIQSSFSKVKPPNPGSAKEKTMLHAIETGKIQSGEAKLSRFREQLQQELGMDVDISIIKIGGPFDNPPFTPLK